MILGYARVSTSEQNLDGQQDALKEAGAGRLFADTITGAVRHRPELDHLLDHVGRGLGPSPMASPTIGWATWLVSWGRWG